MTTPLRNHRNTEYIKSKTPPLQKQKLKLTTKNNSGNLLRRDDLAINSMDKKSKPKRSFTSQFDIDPQSPPPIKKYKTQQELPNEFKPLVKRVYTLKKPTMKKTKTLPLIMTKGG